MGTSIHFWGVRGSVASPGPDTARVGGNTSCIEIQAGSRHLVLDAGTGLRGLGNQLIAQGALDVLLILTHMHWDHIQGLPFFAPLYSKTTRIQMLSGLGENMVNETLQRQMSAPTFPLEIGNVPAQLTYLELEDDHSCDLGDVRITCCKVHHPDPTFAYRIDHDGTSVVYATDTEHPEEVDPVLLELAREANVLIYDAQYLPEEYEGRSGPSRVGWGHSTFLAGIRLARAANVEQLVLFHHDPNRSDAGVEEIEARACELFPASCAAREGMTISLAA